MSEICQASDWLTEITSNEQEFNYSDSHGTCYVETSNALDVIRNGFARVQFHFLRLRSVRVHVICNKLTGKQLRKFREKVKE